MPTQLQYLRGEVPPKTRYSHTARTKLVEIERLF